MSSKPHTCDSCLKLCDEAKQNVKNLQKKVYIMTIVCTSAITLLGEQGAKALLSALNTTTSAINGVENSVKEKIPAEESKDQPKNDQIGGAAWIVPIKNKFAKKENKQPSKTYELIDELSRLPTDNENQITGLDDETIQKIVEAATENTVAESTVLENTPKVTFNLPDNHAVFFTPSLLPFDVYSTTLALGTNYGFGEYYGIDTGSAALAVPQPGAISLLLLSTTLTTRKR